MLNFCELFNILYIESNFRDQTSTTRAQLELTLLFACLSPGFHLKTIEGLGGFKGCLYFILWHDVLKNTMILDSSPSGGT